MEQVALDSSLNELYFGILTVQNGSAELPVALLLYVLNLYGDAKFTRIFGTPILVNFGTVIGVGSDAIETTPNKVYGVSVDGVKTKYIWH